MRTATTILSIFLTISSNAGIVHVGQSGNYATIQEGITAANPGDTVLVADGIYNEQITFWGEPVFVTSYFILDGDSTHLLNTIIDGTGLPYGNASVVKFVNYCDTTSVLAGFTIRNGGGCFFGDAITGGGISLRYSGGKIIHNRIINNYIRGDSLNLEASARGGGIGTNISNSDFWIIISDNLIQNNKCRTSDSSSVGGGIYSAYNTICERNIIRYNKSITYETASAQAGGIMIDGTVNSQIIKAIVKSNSIINNIALSEAMSTYSGGLGVKNCEVIFSENKVKDNSAVFEGFAVGGGTSIMYYRPASIVSNNYFENNFATTEGGALYFLDEEGVEITVCNNTFISNNAFKGGAINNFNGSLVIQNNAFKNNSANYGGAIYLRGFLSENQRFINNSFSENTAIENGGAVYCYGLNQFFLNDIFWNNNATIGEDIFTTDDGSGSIAYCNIDTTRIAGPMTILAGIIYSNPVFCTHHCLMPQSYSPCLDKGIDEFIFQGSDTLSAPLKDIMGVMRPLNNGYDIGAYEVLSNVIHVPADYPTVQQGINAAVDGDIVLVEDSTYYEQINFFGKAITVASNYLIDADTTHISNTILDGDLLIAGNGSVVLFTSGEDTTSIINGFTIRNGKGTYETTEIAPYLIGGGIYIKNSGAKIINNRITHNFLDGSVDNLCSTGGGIGAIWPSTGNWVVVVNNSIDSNQINAHSYDVGGAALWSCLNTRFENNIVNYNSSVCNGPATAYGAVMAVSFPDPGNWFIVKNNIIQYNTSFGEEGSKGAGLNSHNQNSIINGNLIAYNEASAGEQSSAKGSGIYIFYPVYANVKGNDFSNNITEGQGGGIDINQENDVEVLIEENTFKWNQANKGAAISSTSNLHLKNNLFERNSAEIEGGALLITANGALCEIENNLFISNEAGTGGAIIGLSPNLYLVNNIFHRNHALGDDGGAICLRKSGESGTYARLVNNSFSENTAIEQGGAVYSMNCNPQFLNNVFWRDSADVGSEISIGYGTGQIAYSNIDISKIEGDLEILEGVFTQDPEFCTTQCLMPQSWSSCIDQGIGQYVFTGSDTLSAPLFDFTGKGRPLDNGFDVGAYEIKYSGIGIRKVDNDLDISVWPNPFNRYFCCSYTLKETSDVSLVLYDLLGRPKASWNKVQESGEYTFPVELRDVTKGIYLLQVKINDKLRVVKIMMN